MIQGKSVDEIYLAERSRLESVKQSNSAKLAGYIAPEDYELRKNLLRKSSSGLFSEATTSSIESFSQLTEFSQQSQSSDMGHTSGPSHSRHDGVKAKDLNNSSSKNNLGSIVLRENHDSKSAQKMAAGFSGKDQKNVSPYNDKARSSSASSQHIKTNKLLVGGAMSSNLLKVKRQISFDA